LSRSENSKAKAAVGGGKGQRKDNASVRANPSDLEELFPRLAQLQREQQELGKASVASGESTAAALVQQSDTLAKKASALVDERVQEHQA
jgi:hypothetical protein